MSWWRAFAGGEEPSRAQRLRTALLAWVVALALTAPLVVLTGELFGPEAFLVSFLAFPSGLVSLLPQSVLGASESSLSRALLGWMLYGGVSTAIVVSRRPRTARRLLLLLCVLLSANVLGCYARLLGGG